MLSEAYGGEAVKKSSVFEWHERFKKRAPMLKSQMKALLISFLVSRVLFNLNSFYKAIQSTKLMWKC
jgi:hypothetical protein